MTSYTLFETVIGWAALAWNDKGLVGVRLPEGDPEMSRQRLLKRFPEGRRLRRRRRSTGPSKGFAR